MRGTACGPLWSGAAILLYQSFHQLALWAIKTSSVAGPESPRLHRKIGVSRGGQADSRVCIYLIFEGAVPKEYVWTLCVSVLPWISSPLETCSRFEGFQMRFYSPLSLVRKRARLLRAAAARLGNI